MKKFLFLIPAAVGAAIMLLLPFSPDAAEYVFARGIFRGLSSVIGFLTGLFPFSLTEWVLYAGCAALLLCIVLMLLKRLRIRRFFHVLGGILSCAFLLYVLMHGANFYRYETERLLGLDKNVSVRELYRVCVYAAEQANALRVQTLEDDSGCFCLSGGMDAVFSQTDGFYESLENEYTFLSDPVSRPKGVLISPLWSYTGITGMYMPLLAEANINTDIPHSSLYMTAAHELAHTKGFAREDECNFWAYLACSQSGNTDARYSAYLFAYRCLSAELYAADRELYLDVAGKIGEQVQKDLQQSFSYWNEHSGAVSDISDRINDSFIKSQGQAEGTASYNRAALLIAAYEVSAGR